MDDIEKMMAQALAANEVAAQNMVAGALAEREKAAEERAAAREALSETERNEQSIYDGFLQKHRERIARDLQRETEKAIARRMIRAGVSLSEITALLDLPEGMAAQLQ